MRIAKKRLAIAAVCSAAVLGVAAPHPVVAAPVAPVAFTSNKLSTWQTNGIVWAMAQAGGKVFAGGSFTSIRPPGAAQGTSERPAVNFAVFDAATGAPTSCSLSFSISSGSATIRAMAMSPDGKTLYVGGSFDHVGDTWVNSLVAIDVATCAMVPGFHPQVNATVRTISASADAVYFGGDFSEVNGQSRQRLAKVDTAGALSSWAPTADLPVRASVLSPDGTSLVVGGDFDRLNRADSHALGIVSTTTGSNTKTYPLGFIEQNSTVKALTSDASGFYTGNEGTGGGVFDGRIALNWSNLGERWRDTCLGATQAVVSYGGVLYGGSHTHDCHSMLEQPDGRRQHLIAEPTTTGMELPWAPDTNDGIGEKLGPRALTVATANSQPYLWVAGEFTTVNGVAQQGLTHFGTGPDKAPPTPPVLNVAGLTAKQLSVRIRTSTDTDDGTLTYSLYRDGGTTPIWTSTANSLWWTRPQLTFNDTGLTAGSSHTYTVTASDGTNTTTSVPVSAVVPSTTGVYDSKVLADGAKLYWRFDGAGTYTPDSSSGNQTGFFNGGGTYQDGVGPVKGEPSTPMGFDGVTGYVYDEVPQSEVATYSISTWFKTSTKTGGQLVSFNNKQVLPATTQTDKMIYMTNGGRIVFGAYYAGYNTLTTLNALNNGKWHNVVATQGSLGMRLYVDGSLVSLNLTPGTTTHVPMGYWHAGGGGGLSSWPSAPSSDGFQGDLDQTAVFPTALSASQVSDLYAARNS